jgi:type II secretory pathway component PulF
MQTFAFRARNTSGLAVQGKLDAANAYEARKLLAQQQLIPVELKPYVVWLDLAGILMFFKKILFQVPFEDILIFNQQLQTAYSVGIPIVTAMEMIENQTKNKALRRALAEIVEDLRKGRFLGDAMAKHPDVFDEVYVTLVKAGEASGQLDVFLQRISFLLERRADTKAKVKSATFYPKIVFFFIGTSLITLVYVVIPKLKTFFTRFGSELPLPTRIVMGISDVAVGYWYIFLFGGSAAFVGYKYFVSTPRGRLIRDYLQLKVPIMGSLLLQLELNSFCFIAEMLVKSGIAITDSLVIVRNSVTNRVLAREIEHLQREISRGGTMSAGMKRAKIFPEVFVNLVAIGEESGKLEDVFGKIAIQYRREIDYKLTNLSKLIEPILLAVIFVMVGTVMLAVFAPIWNMYKVMRH